MVAGAAAVEGTSRLLDRGDNTPTEQCPVTHLLRPVAAHLMGADPHLSAAPSAMRSPITFYSALTHRPPHTYTLQHTHAPTHNISRHSPIAHHVIFSTSASPDTCITFNSISPTRSLLFCRSLRPITPPHTPITHYKAHTQPTHPAHTRQPLML